MNRAVILAILCSCQFYLCLGASSATTPAPTLNTHCRPNTQPLSHQCAYASNPDLSGCQAQITPTPLNFDYMTWQYCFFNGAQWFGIIAQLFGIVWLFIMLGNTADDYFAPTMGEMADTLGLSHNFAGVTFLAFGNGAPDVASSVRAITTGHPTLGISALLGAAVFDALVVPALIALSIDKVDVARRPFLRDIFFLFVATGIVMITGSDSVITTGEAFGLFSLYFVYAGWVGLGDVYANWKKRRETLPESVHEETAAEKIVVPYLAFASTESSPNLMSHAKKHGSGGSYEEVDDDDDDPHPVHATHRRMTMASDISSDSDAVMEGPIWKVILIYSIMGPTVLTDAMLWLSIPRVDPKHFQDRLAVAQCIIIPFFVLWSFGFVSATAGSVLLWPFFLIFGIIMALLVTQRISRKHREWGEKRQAYERGELGPKDFDPSVDPSTIVVWKVLFLFLSFFSALGWIQLISGELVNILTTLGIAANLSPGILGLTVLAWGNSVPDAVADISVSKRGYPKMGMSAAVGGPTFNIMLGAGFGSFIMAVASGGKTIMPLNTNIFVCALFVLIGLPSLVLFLWRGGWVLPRLYVYYMGVFYTVFLLVNVFAFLRFFSFPGVPIHSKKVAP